MRCQPSIPMVSCRIAFVGEAPGENEEREGRPFIGAAGHELAEECRIAGIPLHECLITNVLMDRPPNNDLAAWCVPRAALPSSYHLPPISPGKYLHPEKLFELERLKQELLAFKPNVIVPLGATALWAICGYSQIGKYRGAVQISTLVPGVKVLPTWHPAGILRAWENRVVAIVDLMKTKRESAFPEIRVTRREVWIEPSVEDLLEFERTRMEGRPVYSIDIETVRFSLISCIGIAPSPDLCLVVPFVDRRKPGYSYWTTMEEEREALRFIFRALSSAAEVLGQNFLYDIWYLLVIGARPRAYCRDTLLKHHAYEPEMTKDLGFMGSIYANELVWKQQRPKRKKISRKRED